VNISPFLDFLYDSPTPFHAVENLENQLKNGGFISLNENESWSLEVGKSYVVNRNQTALIAFHVPKNLKAINLIGAHTDSPTLKIRHVSEKIDENVRLHPIEVYGGVLLHTWLDRDLCLAGEVTVNNGDKIEKKLINFKEPFFKIPSLAIHLDRGVNDNGLKLNKHNHFNAISSLVDTEKIDKELLFSKIAEKLSVKNEDILGFNLSFYDHQKPQTIGLNSEFVSSPRLDNLAMAKVATDSILKGNFSDEILPLVAFFDHEEVGSTSYAGAAGSFLEDVLERIREATKITVDDFYKIKANSVFVSADMAHAIHPNFREKHDGAEFPVMDKGPVIKYNTSERYATDAFTESVIIKLCKENNIPYQRYTHREDLACGSTIGPSTAARIGIKTVDIGNPMLSMHSIREMCSVKDLEYLTKLFDKFFVEYFSQV
jgi:aspartyl aminopeptidase